MATNEPVPAELVRVREAIFGLLAHKPGCTWLCKDHVPVLTAHYLADQILAIPGLRIEADEQGTLRLTADEAASLLSAFVWESRRRYGKVNRQAPLYLRLKELVRVLPKDKEKK